jgi:SIT4-associating protein SAP185/190
LAPPPPPPPLNIPPSRARRQLAARLALHSRQNAENALSSNGGELPSEKSEQQKITNPFATEEDDEEHEDFAIGDHEVKAEGKGHLLPGAALTGQPAPLDDLDLELDEGEAPKYHVGNSSKSSSTGTRAHFPSMWPFGQIQRSNYDYKISMGYREKVKLGSIFGTHGGLNAGSHNKGASWNSANDDGMQSSDESASDDDDSDDEFGASAGIAGATSKSRRRLSTTKATRRTSIEDDDDEGEVVHVARGAALGDDEDLIEIQHAGIHEDPVSHIS